MGNDPRSDMTVRTPNHLFPLTEPAQSPGVSLTNFAQAARIIKLRNLQPQPLYSSAVKCFVRIVVITDPERRYAPQPRKFGTRSKATVEIESARKMSSMRIDESAEQVLAGLGAENQYSLPPFKDLGTAQLMKTCPNRR